jgi:acyl-CoA reductase-like NAD-dependent aldehyde dehydrogenase
LGGKCPAVIDSTADLKLAAERIGNGKFLNAGQTCIAPDFVAVPEDRYDEFIGHLDDFMASACSSMKSDLARLPNRHHFDRVRGLATGEVKAFGEDDEDALRLALRRVRVDWDHPAMQEEVFGPLLPVLPYSDRATLVDRLSQLPSPLALYIFSGDREFSDELMVRVRSGSACINDVMKQALNHELPFGGVGSSGHGRYRGRAGFEAFGLTRPVMRRPQWKDPFFQPPPYGNLLDRLRRFLR